MAKRTAGKKASTRKAAPRSRVSARAAKPVTSSRKAAKRSAAKPKSRAKAAASRSAVPASLFAPVTGAERRNIGHVQLEVGRAGAARVKRMIYPPGFHWAVDMKPVTGTEL